MFTAKSRKRPSSGSKWTNTVSPP